jgi:hypothetical protein
MAVAGRFMESRKLPAAEQACSAAEATAVVASGDALAA